MTREEAIGFLMVAVESANYSQERRLEVAKKLGEAFGALGITKAEVRAAGKRWVASL